MTSRRFVVLTGLSAVTVSFLGCAQEASVDKNAAGAASSSTTAPPASPAPAASSGTPVAEGTQASILSSGTFVSGEHPTKGTVRIVRQGNQRRLELDSAFATSTSGPDLVVILHRLADVVGSTTPPAFPIKEGDYVVLAPLKSYSGAQNYAIPETLNLDNFKSAAIWCRQFNATFGSATLQ